MDITANQRELRHDRHTVSLLIDHLAITPKYRGKILTGDGHQEHMRGNEHQYH
ncbi:MAG: hypothetical protein Q8O41_04330 [Candidatus Methanoperedens sp.]|nr:hypothetical protein [Candidatus Methanoperedens sp.]